MNILFWVLQGLLAAVMLMAGATKAMQGREKLLSEPRMAWVEDYSDSTIRTIGGLEVAAAVGLVLPWALDVAKVLTPLAAAGVVAMMIGAMLTHRRRGEMQAIASNAVIAVVAVVVAIGRFGDL
ncbi:MAG: DoxX family protein [Acidimicrobiia bacterium]|nr:DoxX family protein [Acidimicrobiia bacterium]